jgi:hypothetical protein
VLDILLQTWMQVHHQRRPRQKAENVYLRIREGVDLTWCKAFDGEGLRVLRGEAAELRSAETKEYVESWGDSWFYRRSARNFQLDLQQPKGRQLGYCRCVQAFLADSGSLDTAADGEAFLPR